MTEAGRNAEKRLERVASLTTLLVAMLFAVTLPALYFSVSYSHLKSILHHHADRVAEGISELIYSQPDYWMYQHDRLEEYVRQETSSFPGARVAVLDGDGQEIITLANSLDFPVLTVSAPLNDGARNALKVGEVRLQQSYWPLVKMTAVVTFLGMIVAALVHYTLKVLPFAALSRAVSEVRASQLRLEQEVREKKYMLEQSQHLSDQLRHQATHDALTGLPNRMYFQERAMQLIRQLSPGQGMGVLILDLDRFKDINEVLGHEVGDVLIKQVGEQLADCVRGHGFLARLGGDEFAVLLPEIDHEEVVSLANRFSKTLQQHMVVQSYRMTIQASTGVAYYPKDGDNVVDLMRHADTAMYQAKADGALVRAYEACNDQAQLNLLALSADLKRALDTGQLVLYYQPKVALKTGEITGVEALCRWLHPEHGYIAPDLFIDIAEQGGMINDLTRWVMDTALTQLSDWHALGHKISMAINISAKNLQDRSIVDQTLALLTEASLPPQLLVLELTESSIMTDPETAQQLVQAFSAAGVRMAIDDYGTGYSSLTYLKRLSANELKLDRTFVSNMCDNEEDRVIVRSTIELAHDLGMSVVAEGVENLQTAQLLRAYGCDIAQGYYYCRPMAAMDIQQVLLQNELAGANKIHS